MESAVLFGLLFVALATGWLLGRHGSPYKQFAESSLGRDADSVGALTKHPLQLLFDTYSDDAVDAFLARIEVTPESLSLHISIGRHFRQRGEVDRAILVHQNLLSHPQLSTKSTHAVIFELASDYKSAGLYDRAEALFQQILNSKTLGKKAQYELLTVLEQQGEWAQAISQVSRWERRRDPQLALRLAHYYCELAESALKSGARAEAQILLRKARKASSSCGKVYLLNATLAMDAREYKQAIGHLRSMILLAPDYASLAFKMLDDCSQKTGSEQEMLLFLEQCYKATGASEMLLTWLSVLARHDKTRASIILRESVPKHLSVVLIEKLARLALTEASAESGPAMASVADALSRLQDKRIEQCEAGFVCSECGFAGKYLYWACPGCRSWQSMAPLDN